MRAIIPAIAALLALLFIRGTSAPAHAAPPPQFTEASCADMVVDAGSVAPGRLMCGFVSVPETRGDSDSRTLRLAVAVLKTKSSTPKPDPIVFLTGGPGQSAVDFSVTGWGDPRISGAMQDDRDIVFFDPRGTGKSGALECPEYDRVSVEALLPGGSHQTAEQAVTLCRDRYLADGVDLDAYDSAQSAQDIVAIMQALGYEEWNLYGVSYGAHLAQVALRDTEGVRSVVLDSTPPIQANIGIEHARTFEKTLDTLFAACAEAPACASAYPRLEDEYWELIDRANAGPFSVDIKDVDGAPITVLIDGDTLINGTFIAMYDPTVVALLPLAIHDIASGNKGILTLLAQQLVFTTFGIASGDFLTVLCNEEIPFYTQALLDAANEGVRPALVAAGIDAANSEALGLEQRLCGILGVRRPPAIENRAVHSKVPALILSGRFDPATPPEYGRLEASTLANSFFVEFPTMAHALDFYVPECAGPIAAAFLNNPSQRPDTSCVNDLPPVAWAVPGPPAAAPSPVATGTIGAPNTGQGAPVQRDVHKQIAALLVMLSGLALATAGGAMGQKMKMGRQK